MITGRTHQPVWKISYFEANTYLSSNLKEDDFDDYWLKLSIMMRLSGAAICRVRLIRVRQENDELRENVEEFIDAPKSRQIFKLYSH